MDIVSPFKPQDRERGGAPGTGVTALTHIPANGWTQVALSAWKQSSEDNIGLVAAGVAFYGLLALVPLLGATVLTYGLIAAPEAVLSNVKSLTHVMPADAAKLVGEQLMSVVQTSGRKKGLGLFVALAIALFGARNAAGSVITALNIAYEEHESRGFIKVTLLALLMTAGAVLLAIVAMLAVAALGHLGRLLPHLPAALLMLGKLGSYALLLAGAAAGAATLYRYGPDRKDARWIWITPGSIFASLGWVLLTLGFGFYAANLADYGKTYGSLATVVVLITWMYLSAYILMFGAELNSELEHKAAGDVTIGEAKPAGACGAKSDSPVAAAKEIPQRDGTEVSSLRNVEPTGQNISPSEHLFLISRLAARLERTAGGARVGMLGSALATIGLSMLRRKGRAKLGAALLGTAAALSLLRRKEKHLGRRQR